MNRFLAVLQVGLAVLLFIVAIVCLANMVFIAMLRSETISVVNSIIGLTVMIVFTMALGRILWRRGTARLQAESQEDSESSEHQDVPDA